MKAKNFDLLFDEHADQSFATIGLLAERVRKMEDNKSMATPMRDAHEICDDNKDAAPASLLESFIDETERRTWFLYEPAQAGEHHTP